MIAMNKELKIQCSFAASDIQKNLKKLQDCLSQIKNKRTKGLQENIHQIRVQTRRISAAMKLFNYCFDEKKANKIVKKLKKLRKSMGDARDKDIQIELLNNVAVLKKSTKHKNGIDFLLHNLGEKRKQYNKPIQDSLINFKNSQTIKSISKLLSTFQENSKSGFCISLPIIQKQIQDMLDTIFDLLNSRDISNIHKSRILIKKTRYILEMFPKKTIVLLKSHIAKIKRLQTILGEINDFYIFAEYLNKLNKKNANLDPITKTDINYVLKALHQYQSNKLISLDKYLIYLNNINFQTQIIKEINQLESSATK